MQNLIYDPMTSLMLLIGLNVLVSILGFSNSRLFERLIFHIDPIRRKNQWERLLSSSFVHVDINHLFFNMFTLYIFGRIFMWDREIPLFLTVYFTALVGGSLFSFLLQKNRPGYRAAGASGAVSGVVFGAILMHPDMELSLLFLPFFFPAWIFALVYMLWTIFGIRRGRSRIGHDAHLGGALFGMLPVILQHPSMVIEHPLNTFSALLPPLIFLLIYAIKPGWLER